jgi:hypothetical protein
LVIERLGFSAKRQQALPPRHESVVECVGQLGGASIIHILALSRYEHLRIIARPA